MNKEAIKKIKRIGIPSGIFIAAFLILWGVFYLSTVLKNEAYINAANILFKNSPYCTGHRNLAIDKQARLLSSYPDFCNAVFNAEEDGTAYCVAFVRIYGKYGPYQGVFLYSRETGAAFCGLAGFPDAGKTADRYGISGAVINMWKKKIEALFSLKYGG